MPTGGRTTSGLKTEYSCVNTWMCGMVYDRNIIITKSSKYVIAPHSRHTWVLHLQKGKDCFLPWGFPGGSAGKESTCNAGNPDSIPGSGRSDGEGIDYPLQDSWASLVAQLVKNPPAMQETWVWFLGWEDSLEKGKATHSSILAGRIPRTV